MNARVGGKSEPKQRHWAQDDADETFPQVLLGRRALACLRGNAAVVVSPDGVTAGTEYYSDTEAEEGEAFELGGLEGGEQ